MIEIYKRQSEMHPRQNRCRDSGIFAIFVEKLQRRLCPEKTNVTNRSMKTLKFLFPVILVMAGMVGCKKTPAASPAKVTEGDSEVNKWIFSMMNDHYLWSTDNQWKSAHAKPDYNMDYDAFFQWSLQRPPVTFANNAPHDGRITDGNWTPYSYIDVTDKGDASAAVRSISGNNSFGFEFKFFYFDENPNPNTAIYANVFYVVPGSPADRAGIKRGMWIQKVNDSPISISSYEKIDHDMKGSATNPTVKLLLTDITYQVSGNNITGYKFSPHAEPITLKAERVEESPVCIDTVFSVGTNKIAYLLYNVFDRGRNSVTLEEDSNDTTYEEQLKQAFEKFAREGKGNADLVIDLRYNPGGYLVTCRLLASLIHPSATENTDTFSVLVDLNGKEIYNSYKYFLPTGKTGVNFSLPHPQIYILATRYTASASELLINGLRGAKNPSITVHHIGGRTAGKNVGMNLYEKDFGAKTYSMWPITFQIKNALGDSNYANGFLPGSSSIRYDLTYDVGEFDEFDEVGNLKVKTGDTCALKPFLGMDEQGYPLDPLLRRAVDLITGKSVQSSLSTQPPSARSGGAGIGIKELPFSSLDRKPVRGAILIPDRTETE